MKKNNNIKKISNYAVVGGLGAILVTGLVGCSDSSTNNQQQQGQSAAFSNASQKEGAFVVIEQSKDGRYAIADEFPSSKTTIVLRQPDGSERILSQAEIDKLVKEEEKKIDNGTSALTNPNGAEVSNGGMGLGGVLLSSIAGAMIGSWLGNKLFNNQNYQNQRKTQYKSPQTYSKSQSSFSKPSGSANKTSTAKKSGFFGSKSTSSTSTRSSSFGS
ncbi:MAG: UPF0323 family lipoprotein [Poseidonibacter sp.]|uniref:UPF0323 family lipoprotein n=1 Tax=Poseidonibacter sp. TaxID=2321188 RepID=UPI00359CD05B